MLGVALRLTLPQCMLHSKPSSSKLTPLRPWCACCGACYAFTTYARRGTLYLAYIWSMLYTPFR